MLTEPGIILGLILLLSLLASVATELLAKAFRLRGRHMKKTIEGMLGSESGAFFDHPFFKQLALSSYHGQTNTSTAVPERISSDTFGSLLIDILMKKPGTADLYSKISNVADSEVRELLEYLYRQSGEQLDAFQEKIEYWFDQVMERSTVRYKLKTRWWLFGTGFLVTVVANADILSTEQTAPDARFLSALHMPGWNLPLTRADMLLINWWTKILAFLLMGFLVACCAPILYELFKKLFPPSRPETQKLVRLTPPMPATMVKGLLSENTVSPVEEILSPILTPIVIEQVTIPKAATEKPIALPPAETVLSIAPTHNTLLNLPDPNKLHWGITRNNIHLEWWRDEKITGKGVTIALLGTGFSQFYAELIAIDPQSKIDNALNSTGTGDKAALIAGGNGTGLYGAAPEANLLLFSVATDERSVTAASLLEGIDNALHQGAEVIAILFDLRSITNTEKAELEKMIVSATETVFLAPVGNMVDKGIVERYPAALPGIVGVGSHDAYGDRSIFSARSNHISFLAPGENILIGETASPKNTAIATAFAAGFFALMKQFVTEKNLNVTTSELRNMLEQTATPRRTITRGTDIEYGWGILNPQAVLTELKAMFQKASA